MNPSQKMYIVESLQKLGFMVTLVGDGVNDSPSIKIANTGIAMASGSDAAREASDIIIGQDDLNNLNVGIEEGRRIFDNFKKAICYVMTSQVSEWMPFVFLILSRVPIPIFTLLVDGATDFIPTLAFAYE
jgi:sodium/potassium-transporting ATPase subunit alpha